MFHVLSYALRPRSIIDVRIQVTGWFIAHGGHNGVTEAISAGVPQYAPFADPSRLSCFIMSHLCCAVQDPLAIWWRPGPERHPHQ